MLNCDFCNVPVEEEHATRIRAATFSRSVIIEDLGCVTQSSVGDWCACKECAPFLRRSDWNGLLDRVAPIEHKSFPGIPQSILRSLLMDLWADLRRSLIQ